MNLICRLALACAFALSFAAPVAAVDICNVEARAEDVGSIDALVTAFYAAVNVAPNAPRQWDRDRTLYSP